MADNEFDDIIKKRLQEYNSQIPADMWQRIHADKKKKKPGFLWISCVIALLLLLIISGIYLFNSKQDKKITSVETTLTNKNDADTIDNTHEASASTTSVGINNYINTVEKNKESENKSHHYNSLHHTTIDNNIIADNTLNDEHKDDAFANSNKIFQQGDFNNFSHEDQNENLKKIEAQKLTGEPVNNIDSTNAADVEINDDIDKVSIQFFASPDLPFNSIGSTDAGYHSLLKNATKTRLSYTIGAGVNFHLAKKFFVSTGIHYSQVNEIISFTDSALGDQRIMHNHLSFINLPFTASYRTKWTTAFQTSINAGIMLNILSHYKGNMPNQFGELKNINNVYKSNTAVTIYTGLNFSRSISNKTDVFAEPYLRFQTKNITDNMQPFTRRIKTAGVAFGIRYKLFRDEKE